jgi:allophanate hydrolase subunit 1
MGSATIVMAFGGDYDTTRAVELRATIRRIEGVGFVDFNYTNNKLTVKFDSDEVNLSELQAIVARERKHLACSVEKLGRGESTR